MVGKRSGRFHSSPRRVLWLVYIVLPFAFEPGKDEHGTSGLPTDRHTSTVAFCSGVNRKARMRKVRCTVLVTHVTALSRLEQPSKKGGGCKKALRKLFAMAAF